MLPLAKYDATDREGLLLRLKEVWFDLCNAHENLATSLIAEHDSYMDGMTNSTETSVSGQKRDGEWQSSAFTVEVIRDRGNVAMLEAEKEFLLWLLGVGE